MQAQWSRRATNGTAAHEHIHGAVINLRNRDEDKAIRLRIA